MRDVFARLESEVTEEIVRKASQLSSKEMEVLECIVVFYDLKHSNPWNHLMPQKQSHNWKNSDSVRVSIQMDCGLYSEIPFNAVKLLIL